MSRPLLGLKSASGIRYDEPRTTTVWISHSNTWQRPLDPIYHRVADSHRLTPTLEGDLQRVGWQVDTDCGALVHLTTWLQTPGRHDSTEYRSQEHGLRLPIRWAVQFARPCRRCWP